MSISNDCFKGFLKNDEEAVSNVYFEYKNLMFFIISQYITNKEDIEDVMHDSFIKILENRQSILKAKYLKSYITKTCINTSLDYLKKNKKIVYLEDIEEIYGENDKTNQFLNYLDEKLSNKETIILQYKIVFGYKWKEISQLTNIPITTLRITYKKAIEKLKGEINIYDYKRI